MDRNRRRSDRHPEELLGELLLAVSLRSGMDTWLVTDRSLNVWLVRRVRNHGRQELAEGLIPNIGKGIDREEGTEA